jgi:hypothetical protein
MQLIGPMQDIGVAADLVHGTHSGTYNHLGTNDVSAHAHLTAL